MAAPHLRPAPGVAGFAHPGQGLDGHQGALRARLAGKSRRAGPLAPSPSPRGGPASRCLHSGRRGSARTLQVPTTGRHDPLGPHGREVWPGSARGGAQGTSAGPGPPSFHPPDAQAQPRDPVVISPPTPPRRGSEPAPSPLRHPQAASPVPQLRVSLRPTAGQQPRNKSTHPAFISHRLRDLEHAPPHSFLLLPSLGWLAAAQGPTQSVWHTPHA